MSDISKTDYFAGCALQGLLAYSHVDPQRGNWMENASEEDIAKKAFDIAKAMMFERARRITKAGGYEFL